MAHQALIAKYATQLTAADQRVLELEGEVADARAQLAAVKAGSITLATADSSKVSHESFQRASKESGRQGQRVLHDDSETLGSYMRASGTLDHSSERQNARNREKEEEERRAEIEFLKQVLESTERDRGAEIASLKQQIEKTERQGRIQINKLQQRMASEEGLARITTMALQGQLTVMEKERGAEIASLKEQMGLMEERARCKIVNFKRQLASTQGALASAQKALASTQEALASTEDALVAKDLKVNIGVANMDIMKAKAVVSKRQLSAQVAKYAELEATYDGYRLKYREAEKWERRRAWHDRELQRIRDKARNHHVEAEHRMRRLEERQETTVKDLERNLEACEERGREMEQALGNGGARCKKCDPAHVTELEIEVEKMETDGAVKGEGGEEGEGKPGEEGQGEAMQMG